MESKTYEQASSPNSGMLVASGLKAITSLPPGFRFVEICIDQGRLLATVCIERSA